MRQSEEKEYLLRGRVINISSQIESLIARMIILVNFEQLSEENVPFKKMNYNAKLSKLISLFKQYYPIDYQSSRTVFDNLDSIKEFRNKMAHCIFQWNDPSLQSLMVVDAEIAEDGTHYFDGTKYSFTDVLKKIDDFKGAAIGLLHLIIQIEDRLGQKHPGFLELIRSSQI